MHNGFVHNDSRLMILSCPACATRYTIDESKLGPGGRTVRCSACKTTWHASRPEPEIELPLTAPVRETLEDLQAVKADKVPLKYRAMVEDRKRAREITAQNMIWAGVGVAALVILALAYFLRVDIVRAFPRTAGAYAMAGATTYGTPLQIGMNDAQAKLKGGRFVVTIKTQIKNGSGRPAPVPPVKIGLVDATQQTFDHQLIPSAGLIVPPHATRTLVFDVPDPSNMAKSVDLSFDLEAMKSKPHPPLRATNSGTHVSHPGEEGETDGDHAAPPHAGEASGHEAAPAEATHDAPAEPAHAEAVADAHSSLRADPHADATAPAAAQLRPSVS